MLIFAKVAARARGAIIFEQRRQTGSMRFPVSPEARALREALSAHDVNLHIVNLQAGEDINEAVFEAIERCDAFLVFGTQHYGEKTDNPACVRTPSIYSWRDPKSQCTDLHLARFAATDIL
eukprot:COSAG02_NODE_6246_length_3702_cov_6.692478_2_plen_121_part_00